MFLSQYKTVSTEPVLSINSICPVFVDKEKNPQRIYKTNKNELVSNVSAQLSLIELYLCFYFGCLYFGVNSSILVIYIMKICLNFSISTLIIKLTLTRKLLSPTGDLVTLRGLHMALGAY